MSDTMAPIERWGVFELQLPGPSEGNPFVEVQFAARFQHKHRVVQVDGFYDGEGTYRVRFMPDTIGSWQFETSSNVRALAGRTGKFECTAPSPGNHGPVHVHNRVHLAYADGTPYWPFGTTCYAWVHQGDELEAQTLTTLRNAPFNKMRMCVFPKHFQYNRNEPLYYPFEGQPMTEWDWTRFNPLFWRHVEERVTDLGELGIEADLVLFHPYDRWGFATMDLETDERYLRYALARLAAFRNVWWSLANEYDLMRAKTMADWDRLFRIIQEDDPYAHLRSVHNCHPFYDYSRPWVTHCSIQHIEAERVDAWRSDYQKPIIVDECRYEGNIPSRWGCIPAREMVRKFWEGTVRGGYIGHGETFVHPDNILWWSKGGTLHGQSPARIGFLRRIIEDGPSAGLDPVEGVLLSRYPCAARGGQAMAAMEYLAYFGIHQPTSVPFQVPEDTRYAVDVIDTWEMAVTTLADRFSGSFTVPLPGKPYIAVRLRRAD